MADVLGAAELQKALQAMSERILAAVEQALDDSVDAIRDDARRNVPVDTGRLQRAIKIRNTGELKREVGVLDANAYYGAFIEHGTSTRPARPFLLPAAERERRRVPQRVSEAINKELR